MKKTETAGYGDMLQESMDLRVSEHAFSYGEKRQGDYTLEDYYALPDDQRVELIDGVFYDMSSPLFIHQRVGGEMHRQIANYIMERGGKCIPFHRAGGCAVGL